MYVRVRRVVAVALKPGDRVTLSLSARVLINVEALNMAETVGNVSRHRKAPIVVPPKEDEERGQEYSLVYVPAVSGESIAHHYQKIFVSLAKQRGLPVPKLEDQGYFLKYASDEVLYHHYYEIWEKLTEIMGREDIDEKKKMCEMERELVRGSAVADVAGFLFTGEKKPRGKDVKPPEGKQFSKEVEKGLDMQKPTIKRTSRIHFSYLIPALETVKQGVVAAQSQIHVRYSPQAKEGEQALFYVEGSSALYTFSVVFVASDVGKLEYCIDVSSSKTQGGSSQEEAKRGEEERKKRVDVALDALLVLLDSMTFGAKRARYLPHWQYDSIVAAVSKGPVDFVVSSASNPHYIQDTVKRAKDIKGALKDMDISIFAYARSPGSVKPPQPEPGVTVSDTPTGALAAAANKVRELMGIAPQAPRK